MKNYKSILQTKKNLCNSKKLTFSMRKTKIGLISCIIGASFLLTIAVSNAEEVVEERSIQSNNDTPISLELSSSESTSVNGTHYVVSNNSESSVLSDTSDNNMLSENSDSKTCEYYYNEKTDSNEISFEAKMKATDGTDKDIVIDKTKNPYNDAHDHTNPTYEQYYGPGDLDFNYWTNKKNLEENIRVNFGTEYNLDNSKLIVELPYSNSSQLYNDGKLLLNDSSKWLVERLYNNNSTYEIIDSELLKNPEFIDNKVIFNFGNIKSRTAGSLEFKRLFDSIDSFENSISSTEASAKIVGNISFENIILPGDKEIFKYIGEIEKDVNLDDYEYKQKFIENPDGTITKNGYFPKSEIRVEKIENPLDCDELIITKSITDEVDLRAESVMDTSLKDYSNNGYLEKVMNEDNHKISEDKLEHYKDLFGPGNLEVQHWQSGDNSKTSAQNWRIVFATDYAISNGKIVVNLPYELDRDFSITDSTDWLINRYYPAVVGESNYSNLNIINDTNYIDKIKVDGKTLIIDIGEIPSRTALSFVINKKFPTPQDFSNDLKSTSVNVTGNWRMYNNYVNLPNSVKEHIYKCGKCDKDSVINKPQIPNNDNNTEIPILPIENTIIEKPSEPQNNNTNNISEEKNENKLEIEKDEVIKNNISVSNNVKLNYLPKMGSNGNKIFEIFGSICLILLTTIMMFSEKRKNY